MVTIAYKTRELQAMEELFCSNTLLTELADTVQAAALQATQAVLEQALAEELTAHLGLQRYERVSGGRPPEQQRSGSYTRGLVTSFGELPELHVPKLRRGNKVREWQILERYQQLWRPLVDQALHDYVLGLSLRDLQEQLYGTVGRVLSVNAVNRITLDVQSQVESARLAPLSDVPPTVLVDGVWVQVLQAQEETFVDRAGHRRQRQVAVDQVILTAMGVWPDGRHTVIHFRAAEAEDAAGWQRFWAELHTKGVTPSTTWLVVSDGTSGLPSALRQWMPSVRQQRCTFHKIKNISENLAYHHLDLDAHLPPGEAQRQARQQRQQAIVAEASAIYEVAEETTIRERAANWRQHWQAVEPIAVRRFFHEFELTLSFLHGDFPQWHLIHTTNLLERFFEEFRRKADEIGCFPNADSALAIFYLVARREAVKRTAH